MLALVLGSFSLAIAICMDVGSVTLIIIAYPQATVRLERRAWMAKLRLKSRKTCWTSNLIQQIALTMEMCVVMDNFLAWPFLYRYSALLGIIWQLFGASLV